MQNLKTIIDTVAVLVGNLLNLTPTGWTSSKEEAAQMRAAKAKSKDQPRVEVLDGEDNTVGFEPAQALSPLEYCFSRAMNFGSAVLGMYLFYIVIKLSISLFFSVLVIVAIISIAAYAYEFFFGKPENAAAQEGADQTAAA